MSDQSKGYGFRQRKSFIVLLELGSFQRQSLLMCYDHNCGCRQLFLGTEALTSHQESCPTFNTKLQAAAPTQDQRPITQAETSNPLGHIRAVVPSAMLSAFDLQVQQGVTDPAILYTMIISWMSAASADAEGAP